jgi:hypothetical protein
MVKYISILAYTRTLSGCAHRSALDCVPTPLGVARENVPARLDILLMLQLFRVLQQALGLGHLGDQKVLGPVAIRIVLDPRAPTSPAPSVLLVLSYTQSKFVSHRRISSWTTSIAPEALFIKHTVSIL